MNNVGKSVLLIGNTTASSVISLQQEAKKQGIVFECVSSGDAIALVSGDSPKEGALLSRDFFSFDTYFFRGISGYLVELQPVVQELLKRNKRIVERFFAEHGFLPEDKLVPASISGVYKVPTSKVVSAAAIETELPSIHFPVVVKKLGVGSSMGKMVILAETAEELLAFSSTVTGSLMLQEYYHIEYDTRVIVVGEKCLGGFNRFKSDAADFITTRGGGSRDLALLTPQQEAAAIEATKLQGLEIAGVDIFVSNDEVYIIEVNSSPQFRVFEKSTGVNVAKEILTYLVK